MGSNFHAKILLVDEEDASFVCVLWVRARLDYVTIGGSQVFRQAAC